MHVVARAITDALDGSWPVADGGWERTRPWRVGVGAVVAFTAHAFVVDDGPTSDARLDALGVDGYGGAHHPRVVSELAGPDGWIDSVDLVLAGRGAGAAGEAALVARPDLGDHPRVAFARGVRGDVRVFGRPDPEERSVVTLATGLAGLTELNLELDPRLRGRGLGATLARDALGLVPAEELVVAAVAPGNAASVRALLAAGLGPVASVQLYRPGASVQKV